MYPTIYHQPANGHQAQYERVLAQASEAYQLGNFNQALQLCQMVGHTLHLPGIGGHFIARPLTSHILFQHLRSSSGLWDLVCVLQACRGSFPCFLSLLHLLICSL